MKVFFLLFLLLRSCVGLFLHRVFQTMCSCIVMTRCVSSAVSSFLQTDNSCSLGSVGEKSIHINTKRSYCPLSLNQFPKNQFFLVWNYFCTTEAGRRFGVQDSSARQMRSNCSTVSRPKNPRAIFKPPPGHEGSIGDPDPLSSLTPPELHNVRIQITITCVI